MGRPGQASLLSMSNQGELVAFEASHFFAKHTSSVLQAYVVSVLGVLQQWAGSSSCECKGARSGTKYCVHVWR